MVSENMTRAAKQRAFKAYPADSGIPGLEIDVNVASDHWAKCLPHAAEMIKETISKLFSDRAICREDGPRNGLEISVLLTGDEKMAELNGRFRGQNSATNVLSFPNSEKDEALTNAPHTRHLGDIILAFETLCREADERNISRDHHLMHLTIHGLLHLLGFEHSTSKDAEEMEAIEVRVLAVLGVDNPYQDRTGVAESPEA